MFPIYYKQYGNRILFRYKKHGDTKTRSKVVDFYQPTLYVPDEKDEDGESLSIYDEPLKAIKFDGIKDAKDFAETYKNVEGFEIHGNSNYANQFIIELFEGKDIEFDPSVIRVGILDIEVDSDGSFPEPDEAKWPINGITVYDSVEQRFYSYMLLNASKERWRHDLSPTPVCDLSVDCFHFEDEESLLRAFLSHMNDHDYDITSGWHSEGFDMPYIVNRCFGLFGEGYTSKMLSPFNKINIREIRGNFGKTQQKVDVVGVPHLDYMELYKKHIFTPRESYKLDFIGHEELGEKKIDYSEASTLFELYNTNFQKFTDYNIQDVNLIRRLDEKLGLFDLTYVIAYYTTSNYADTLGSVKVWENLIAKFLYNKGKVPPFNRKDKPDREFDGAYVKEPVPGFYDWVVSFDLASLYPHIIQQVNIGPETRIDHDGVPEEVKKIKDKYNIESILNKEVDLSSLHDHDLSMAANFEVYRKDKMSFFSEIMRDLYKNRKVYKKKMLEAEREKVRLKNEIAKRGLKV